MSSQLKISADTSEVKKSILDLGKTMKDLKGSKVQIFTAEDKRFMKTEFKKEVALMKQKLKENREEIKKMVDAQKEMTSGSKEELEQRKKILEAYKTQARLGKQLGQAQSNIKRGGDIDKGGGGLLGGLMNFARMIPGLAAVATIGYAMSKGMQANDQYVQGVGTRNRLKGLGVSDENFGSPDELARLGLTEQDMIQRRADATALLGRQGTSQQIETQKAAFERAFGLDGGTMTGIAGQLRGQMGGAGATDAQMKLQASVLAAGIEDAVGPYLESAVQLLTAINENGMTNTSEMTAMLAQLTADGVRTPEQMAKTFEGINNAVKGASGEQSALLQAAFARSGIGGGTIGGTKFAMQSGGIMGLNRKELERRGYNKDLLNSMEQQGMIGEGSGLGKRTGAILDFIKTQGGMSAGESIGGIKDSNQMAGMSNLAGSALGIKDPAQAFDALMLMEKVQKGQMGQKEFDKKLKDMQESQDPVVNRLDKINNTLSGISEVLRTRNTNLMENLGKEAVQAGNQIVRADNEGIQGVKNVAGAINDSGATQKAGDAAAGAGKFMNSGAVGGWLGDKYQKWFGPDTEKMTSDDAVVEAAKKRFREGTGFKGMKSEEDVEKRVRDSLKASAKEIGAEIGKNVKISTPDVTNNINVQSPSGNVTNRTYK